jgi:uncharacterized protein YdcH (DUF465 family)
MDKRMTILIERHQKLDDEVDKLNEKRYLTPTQTMYLKTLKVRRLRLRDAISQLEEDNGS